MGVESETREQDAVYEVVVNDEEQYSIWLADRPPPAGWRAVGFRGPRSACLEHVATVWTDMRPRSLREAMERDERRRRQSTAAG
jgi:MbtH protein